MNLTTAQLLALGRELVPLAKKNGLTLRKLQGFAADALPVLEQHGLVVNADVKAGVELAGLVADFAGDPAGA